MAEYDPNARVIMPPADPEGIRREVRERMLARLRARTPADGGPEPVPGVVDVAALRDAAAGVRSAEAAVGGMPPQPPTLRAWIGAAIIRVMRRSLFWYTGQIVRVNSALSRAIEAHGRAIESLSAALEASTEATRGVLADVRTSIEECRAHRHAEFEASIEARLSAIERKYEDEVAPLVKRHSFDEVTPVVDRRWSEHEARLRPQIDAAIEGAERRLADAAAALAHRLAQNEHAVALIRSELAERERRLPDLPRPPAQGQPSPGQEGFASEEDKRHESLYVALQDEFRGARDDIKNRLRVYLPRIKEAAASTGAPVLDIGCGRGEWLELLRENEIAACGIDSNPEMVERCAEFRIEVTEAEALAHLRGLPASSLGAVTAFHVLEHLPFEAVVDLIDEALRVLAPGGIAIVETPNPENILTATHYFFLDPTHRKILPPLLLQTVVEARGFTGVQLLRLHPWPKALMLSETSETSARYNDAFYGAQDYAIIARKP